MTLMERRRALMGAGKKDEHWDYEWNASSGVRPPDSTVSTISISDGIATVTGLSLQFAAENVLTAEISCTLRIPTTTHASNNPGIGIKRQSRNGAKIYYDASNLKFAGMTAVASATVDNEFHTLALKYENSTYHAFLDGVEVANGTGRTSSYDMNGIIQGAIGAIDLKEIKYRRMLA